MIIYMFNRDVYITNYPPGGGKHDFLDVGGKERKRKGKEGGREIMKNRAHNCFFSVNFLKKKKKKIGRGSAPLIPLKW